MGEALDGAEKVLCDLASGNYRISQHARQRMSERGATDSDLREAGRNGKATVQGNGKYRVEGLDLDGDEIDVICAEDGDTTVVTVF